MPKAVATSSLGSFVLVAADAKRGVVDVSSWRVDLAGDFGLEESKGRDVVSQPVGDSCAQVSSV